ncbi:MAG: late competence development ComFB family protein [Treponema sp.]|jgi:competence protein ComFB|nr:late competence development ComFB family protein [Treponema sp.]
MAFIDNYDLENFKNKAENLVFEELERQLESYPEEICMCNECVIDMSAIALNSVKPLYCHSILGTLYMTQVMNEDEEYAQSIREAVGMAINRVKHNPGHELHHEQTAQDGYASDQPSE